MVVLHTDAVVKHNVAGASGLNSCYIMDSDKAYPRPVPFKDALRQIGARSLRYPYGRLGDNYLWNWPYTDISAGLRPRVASMNASPGNMSWCVRASGTDKGYYYNDLGFDDFIAICKELNIEPLIMVCALAYKTDDGYTDTFVTLDDLANSAAAWVKYANITKGYGVKYWQIGNECDQHTANAAEYVTIYQTIARKMKAVDPAIKIGTGINGKSSYNKQVLDNSFAEGLVNFISVHQYTYPTVTNPDKNPDWLLGGYPGWSAHVGDYYPSVKDMQDMIDANPQYKSVEIMVTETNPKGEVYPEGTVINANSTLYTNDIYKSLIFFEMNMTQLACANVRYTYFWCTHSPWWGDPTKSATPDGGLDVVLDRNNNPTAMGKLIGLVNANLLPGLLKVTPQTVGMLRFYATVSDDGKTVTLFALNKDNTTYNNFTFGVSGNTQYKLTSKTFFFGSSPQDEQPTVAGAALADTSKVWSMPLPGCSLSLFRMEKKSQ